MYHIKEKINPGLLLRQLTCAIIYAALGFSIIHDGSYLAWRKTMLQTLIFLAFLFYLLERRISGKQLLDKSLIDIPIRALALFMIVISFFALNKGIAFNGVIQVFSCVCGFYIFVSMAKRREEQVRLLMVVSVITLLLCLYGLMVHFKIYPVRNWQYITLMQKGMLSATFANHNHLAGWLEMAILVFTGLFFARKWPVSAGIMMVAGYFIMILTLVCSLSRGGWTATAAGSVFILTTSIFSSHFRTPKNIIPAIIGLISLILLMVLGSNPVVNRSITLVKADPDLIPGRAVIWKGTLDMIKTYPFTGTGPGNYSTILPRFQPAGIKTRFIEAHNDYLQFIAETGMFFIPLLIWLVIAFFKTGFKKLNHPSRQTRWITLGAMGGVAAILVHSAVDFNLQIPSNALLFTLLAALVAAPAPALKK